MSDTKHTPTKILTINEQDFADLEKAAAHFRDESKQKWPNSFGHGFSTGKCETLAELRELSLVISASESSAERDRLREIVDAQAEDKGLWFEAKTAPEAYLQQELRRLHAAIEGIEPDEAARTATANAKPPE